MTRTERQRVFEGAAAIYAIVRYGRPDRDTVDESELIMWLGTGRARTAETMAALERYGLVVSGTRHSVTRGEVTTWRLAEESIRS